MSISSKIIFKIVLHSYNRTFHSNVKVRNKTPKPCWAKEIRHRSIYAIWFYPIENIKICKINLYNWIQMLSLTVIMWGLLGTDNIFFYILVLAQWVCLCCENLSINRLMCTFTILYFNKSFTYKNIEFFLEIGKHLLKLT